MSVAQSPHEIINGKELPSTGLYDAVDLEELRRYEVIADRVAVLEYLEQAEEVDGFHTAGNRRVSIHSFVFDAIREGSERPEYVMKVLAPVGRPAEKDVVPKEVELLDELSGHPNIPTLSSYGWIEGTEDRPGTWYYITEKAMRGRLSDQPIAESEATARQYLGHLADSVAGLGELHARGYAHNDFKGENVYIQSDGVAVLGDLGSAVPLGLPEGSIPKMDVTPMRFAPELEDAAVMPSETTDTYEVGAAMVYDLLATKFHRMTEGVKPQEILGDPVRFYDPRAVDLAASMVDSPENRPTHQESLSELESLAIAA
jgi:serine/threonine protein kinase